MKVDLAQIARIAEELDALCGGDERCFADMLTGETDIDQIARRAWEIGRASCRERVSSPV